MLRKVCLHVKHVIASIQLLKASPTLFRIILFSGETLTKFNIYYTDHREQAEYIMDNTILRNYQTNIKKLHHGKTSFAYNPDELKDILYLDLPDIIATSGTPEKPVFSIEFCGQKPVGFNIHQRFARAVASADFKIPFAYVFPERAWVVRKGSERWDYVDPRIYMAMLNAMQFHSVPILTFNWVAHEKSTNDGKILVDKNPKYRGVLPPSADDEMQSLFSFLDTVIDNFLRNRKASDLVSHPNVMKINRSMWAKFTERGGDSGPPGSCKIIPSEKLSDYIESNTGLNLSERFKHDPPPEILNTRKESFVFVTSVKKYRADPYTGFLPVLDYCYCRTGQNIRDRYRNLIFHFTQISYNDVKAQCARYHQRDCALREDYKDVDRFLSLHLREGCKFTKPKELRIYFYFADVVIFKDTVVY